MEDDDPNNTRTYVDSLSNVWEAAVDIAENADERYAQAGNTADLDISIDAWRRAAKLTPDSSSQLPGILNNLAVALQTRFKVVGNGSDLEEAVALCRRVFDLTAYDDPENAARSSNLGCALHSRFTLTSDVDDLNNAITLGFLAVELASEQDPDFPAHLYNLGDVLLARFERFGDVADLQLAINLETRAVAFTPDDHPRKALLLTKLAGSIQARFKHLGNPADLEHAVVLKSRSVEITSGDPTDKAFRLDSLGISLHARFERTGSLEDLQSAIDVHRRAVELTPDGYIDKPFRLGNLGTALQSRFERLGNVPDLQEAIGYHAHANELTPDAHCNKAFQLNNLGVALQSRFVCLGDIEDVDEAVRLKTRAVELTPDGQPYKCSRLGSLGTTLRLRFNRSDDLSDLEAAVDAHTRAIELTPADRPDKVLWQHNLSTELLTRFDRVGHSTDLAAAISTMTAAVQLVPTGHPHRTMMLRELARAYRARLNSVYVEPQDLTKAMEAYAQAMQHTSGLPERRLFAGLDYIDLLSHPSVHSNSPPIVPLLDAYEQILALVPQVVWLGHNIPRRYEELLDHGTLANAAAAHAISVGDHARALEWLESGRTVVWGQILRLRTPLDGLRDKHPEVAVELERVSWQLRKSGEPESKAEGHFDASISSAIEYERLMAQIRALPGFSDFLRAKKFPDFAEACASGPIAVINVHKSRCDGLVLCRPGRVVHVPLPGFSFDRAKELQQRLWSFLKDRRLLSRFRGAEEEERRGGRVRERDGSDSNLLRGVLADLWTLVAKPILDVVLALPIDDASGRLPHLTWCPTGPLVFLPLHAAGVYSDVGPSQTVMDTVLSSYTPTLETLLRARGESSTLPVTTAPDIVPARYPKILAVAQPDTPGCTSIPGTQTEVKHIHNIFKITTDVLSRAKGTVEAVLDGMRTHEWVHLACHGVQLPRNPPDNCWFALHDGKLTLPRLMSESLCGELAVLSACQTATGDEKLPEEAVHLAAGMLAVGYKNVVGMMWSISDWCTPSVMKKFYEVLAEQVADGGTVRPAYALQEATKALRHEYGTSHFERWVPFVHLGMS